MAAILKIAFLVCFTFVFLAPAGVRARMCVHCISQALNVEEAKECIGPENTKFQDTVCNKTLVCQVNDITVDGVKKISRGCVKKPTPFTVPCCIMVDDPANVETKVTAPIPYMTCYCDKDNCNTQSGTFTMGKLPDGFIACPPGTIDPPGPTPQPQKNSQDTLHGSSLSALGAICLTVFVFIPAGVSHLQY